MLFPRPLQQKSLERELPGLVSKNIGGRDFPEGPVFKTPPSNAGGVDSVSGWGTKILHAAQHGQKKKKKENKITSL